MLTASDMEKIQKVVKEATSNLVTMETLQTVVNEATSNLVTMEKIQTVVKEATSNLVTMETLQTVVNEATSNLATKEEITGLKNDMNSRFDKIENKITDLETFQYGQRAIGRSAYRPEPESLMAPGAAAIEPVQAWRRRI